MSNKFAHPTNGAEVIQLDTLNLNSQDFSKFSDDEIIRAVELMISPDDLTIRDVAEAILKSLSYTPQEVAEQLKSGERLNAGAYFDFHTTTKRKSVA